TWLRRAWMWSVVNAPLGWQSTRSSPTPASTKTCLSPRTSGVVLSSLWKRPKYSWPRNSVQFLRKIADDILSLDTGRRWSAQFRAGAVPAARGATRTGTRTARVPRRHAAALHRRAGRQRAVAHAQPLPQQRDGSAFER